MLLCLQRKPRKCFKRHRLVESESAFHADILYVCSSFTKLKSDHSVFASNFKIKQSNLDKKLLMLHVAYVASLFGSCLKCSG